MTSLPALLLLADGRFPVGGHAHSAGIEAAISDGRIADLDDIEAFVAGRLHTTGLSEAALAAATVWRLGMPGVAVAEVLKAVDAAAEARLPVAPLRAASRRLGRQLIRVAGSCWPDPILFELAGVHPDGAHQPVALGGVAVAAGLDSHQAAVLTLHHAVTTPIQAAIKIAGFDPFALAAMTVRFTESIRRCAEVACAAASGPLASLPCAAGPLVEIAAIRHESVAHRLFAT